MYRSEYSSYDSYAIKKEIAKQLQELPNDLNELREIFEDQYKNNLKNMFDRVLRNEDYQENSTELQYRYIVKVGWHTPFEILFEAMGMDTTTEFEGRIVDAMHYESIIGAMLTAKYGTPIGFRFEKLLQVAQLVLESYPHFYNIFISICHYYGNYEALVDQDKKGNLRKKEIERKDKIEKINHNFSEIIEFLCPKLNGRLIFHKINHEKLTSDKDLKNTFYPLKLFTSLFNNSNTEIDRELAEQNNKEIFELIKNYIKLSSYENYFHKFGHINDITTIKILHFLHYYCDFACENDLGLYARSHEGYAKREVDSFIKLVHLLELEDYIVDGLYDDKSSNCLHINCTFDKVDELDKYYVKGDIKEALKLTISYYEFEGEINTGYPMGDARYRFGVDSSENSVNPLNGYV